ncbi:hypothetical protein [Aeromonas veronii]|uniref:hypothetical protein n=1 Tax=Aeromonas veronii TaxID=654 RepID=UPI003BA379A4
MSSSVVKIIEPALIGDLKSYWAMHFCAVLEVLYEHKNLEFNFQKTIPYKLPKTLASFVGISERGFFARIRENVRNWGLQYFLCHYLMSAEGYNVFKVLADNISNNYNFDLLRNIRSYGVFVCGIDSYSGSIFLQNTNAGILGYNEKTISNVWEDIKYVDLCILIERNEGDLLDTAILGEVEGNKALKLFGSSYWGKKSSVCLFGIGVQQGSKYIEIHNFRTESGIKSIVSLGSNFAVIDDFQSAIGLMEIFLSLNHQHKVFTIPGQSDVVEIIRQHWNQPIENLIAVLRGMINRVDSASLGTNPLTIPSVPKIIT